MTYTLAREGTCALNWSELGDKKQVFTAWNLIEPGYGVLPEQ